MNTFIDIHQHILYGLDDGPKTYQEMTIMLRAAQKDGIGTIFATPHMMPGVQKLDEALMNARLKEANEYCECEGLSVCVLPGAEILYTPALHNYMATHRLRTLGDTRYVLIEFTPSISFADIENAVILLNRYQYVPILAHVERYPCLRSRKGRLKRLRKNGDVFFQVNCASVLGVNGYWTKRFVWTLIKEKTAGYIASDAHNADDRRCRMSDTYALVKKITHSAKWSATFGVI